MSGSGGVPRTVRLFIFSGKRNRGIGERVSCLVDQDHAGSGGVAFRARVRLCDDRPQSDAQIDVRNDGDGIEEGSRMAQKPGQGKSLHELRQEAAHSRDRLARDLSGVRYELDFPLKFRKSFQRQTVLWIGAAVVVGVVFAVMPARRKKVRMKAKGKSRGEQQKEGILGAGLALGVLKLVATMLKPTVTAYVAKKMSGYAAGPTRRS